MTAGQQRGAPAPPESGPEPRWRVDWPTLGVAVVAGVAIWMPTMAFTEWSRPPGATRWAWYLGFMLVAAVALGRARPGRGLAIGIGLVAPQLVLAVFSNPRVDAAPWYPIFPILVLVGVAAAGVAHLVGSGRSSPTPSERGESDGCVVQTVLVFGIGGLACFALLTVGMWLVLIRPYQDAEHTLRAEARALHIPGASIVASKYTPGGCLDNCPELDVTYRFRTATSCRVLAQIATQLEMLGYRGVSPGIDVSGGHGGTSISVRPAAPRGGGEEQCPSPDSRFDTLYASWVY